MSTRLLLLAASLAALAFPAAAQVTVEKILTTGVTATGQPIVLPKDNVEVIVSTYDIAAGAKLPSHEHPSTRYAYVMSGELRVINTEMNEATTYKTGDFIIEAIGQWHYGEAIGSEPVRLLVIDQIEKGQSTVILETPAKPAATPAVSAGTPAAPAAQ
ncbi:cupin domain-containing protein [Aurantimonas aggregata]|uniref:Cupin domain-containing protein n=1 Tax=Aurantimonas aggregata TaxID=2047720 RepID=A0A6L9MLL0_9HYPH|nr:cupin domain-containing protein [Aurantimonas aggregata]NDV88428.1 cupin domain-containing protein [Aurantimonas aggregata]